MRFGHSAAWWGDVLPSPGISPARLAAGRIFYSEGAELVLT